MSTVTQYRYSFRYLKITLFLINIFFSIQTTTLPLYILHLGGNPLHIGILSGISSIVAMFFRPIIGRMLDTMQRTRIFSVGIIIYILSTLCYIFAHNYYVLILAKGLFGIGLCAVSSSTAPITYDLCSNELTDALYSINVVQILGSLAAPQIGIWFASKYGFQSLYIMTAVGYLLSYLAATQIHYEEEKTPTNIFSIHWQDIFEPRALVPGICMIFHGLSHCTIGSFMSSYGASIGIQNIGFYTVFYGSATILLHPVLKRFSHPKYDHCVFLTGCVAFYTALLLFLSAKGAISIAIAAIFFSAAYNTTYPILNSIALRSAGTDRSGAANATYYILWDIGYGYGSFAMGAVANQFGYPVIYQLGILSLSVLVGIYFAFLHKSLKKQEITSI